MAEPIALFGWSLVAITVICARPLAFDWRWRACAALTVVYFFCCSPAGANFLVGELERRAAAEARRCGDPPPKSLFIVLGGGVTGSTHDAGDYARLQAGSLRRLIGAVELARRAPESVLLLSGGAEDGGISQGELMASMARALGMPPARLMVESQSATTYEQARNINRLLGPNGTQPRYLVTSALHMPRALATFLSSGMQVCGLPVDFRQIPAPWFEALVPQLTALTKTSEAVHELAGYSVYVLRGRIAL